MKNTNSNSGGALVLVMIVLLTFSVLSIGLFKLHETDAVETVYVEQTDQAFWVAEAGLQRALNKLRTNKTYRDTLNTDTESGSIDNGVVNGSYTNDLWRNGSGDNFVIESQGKVRGISRRLHLDVTLSQLGDYAIAVLDGKITSELGKDGTINGNVYLNGGGLNDGGADINGTVYADNPPADKPWETLTEDSQLDIAIGVDQFMPKFELPNTVGTILDPLKLSNTTVVVNTLNNINRIEGPGTVVVKGAQTFRKDLFIGDGVTLIVDGKLTIQKDATFGKEVILFSTGDIDIFKAATGTGCAFLCLGDMSFKMDLDFDGILFTEGTLSADKNLNVTGTIITQDGFDMKKNATVSFTADVIPSTVWESMITSTYVVQSSSWSELQVD